MNRMHYQSHQTIVAQPARADNPLHEDPRQQLVGGAEEDHRHKSSCPAAALCSDTSP
jgi:hypothetical protein